MLALIKALNDIARLLDAADDLRVAYKSGPYTNELHVFIRLLNKMDTV